MFYKNIKTYRFRETCDCINRASFVNPSFFGSSKFLTHCMQTTCLSSSHMLSTRPLAEQNAHMCLFRGHAVTRAIPRKPPSTKTFSYSSMKGKPMCDASPDCQSPVKQEKGSSVANPIPGPLTRAHTLLSTLELQGPVA